MANAVEEFSGKISLLSKWVASIGLLLMTAIIVVQVFSRYVLNDSPVWAEQAALLLMIWYVFIAAAAGVREGFHIRIAVIAESLPEVLQRWVRLLTHFLVLMFGVAMAVFGAQLAAAILAPAEHLAFAIHPAIAAVAHRQAGELQRTQRRAAGHRHQQSRPVVAAQRARGGDAGGSQSTVRQPAAP